MERAMSKIKAKELLSGRWANAVGAVALFFIVAAFGNAILAILPFIGFILGGLLAYYFKLSFNKYCVKLNETDERVKYNECFLDALTFFKTMGAQILTGIVVFIIPFIIIMVGMFQMMSSFDGTFGMVIVVIGFIVELIFAIYYSLTFFTIPFIFIEDDEIGVIDGIKRAMAISKGFKWKYFVFLLSFIGWYLLACITFGIGLLWLSPYFVLSTFLFYKHMTEKKTI